MKAKRKVKNDTDLDAGDLKKLCVLFKEKVREVFKKIFLMIHMSNFGELLELSFLPGMEKELFLTEKLKIFQMSGGRLSTSNQWSLEIWEQTQQPVLLLPETPGNGENKFYGEYLVNAQGEDVVAGIRTPAPINEDSKNDHNKNLLSLEKACPNFTGNLFEYQKRLEKHYRDM